MRRTGVVLVSGAMFAALCGTQLAEAAPPPACLDLSKRFGGKPELLSTSELAQLRTCITNELSSRLEEQRAAMAQPSTTTTEPTTSSAFDRPWNK